MIPPVIAGAGSPPDLLCICGAVHRAPIDAVVVDESAVERLAAYVKARRWSRPFVVMDANTEDAAGWRVIDELSRANLRVTRFCFPERSGLRANETSVFRLDEAMRESATDSTVAVGSGVITDLIRYVASRMGREFVSVPTAASMDGYASSVAAMEFGGIRTSYPAVPPVAIFADPSTIAAAPPEMTRAGLGDLLGKATAAVDWLASHRLYGEQFCAEVERRVSEPLLHAATHAGDILEGSKEAVAGLLRGLIESGIAMAMVGSSRPASGCEHHASHFWDLLAANGRRSHSPHGLQVGYATHFAMGLQRFAFAGGVPELAPPRPIVSGDDGARSWFAGHGAEVEAVMEEKRRFLRSHASAWPAGASHWKVVQEQLSGAARRFPLVAEALWAASIPAEPGFLGIDEATLRATFRWANRIRSRYTVLDFLEGQGRLDEAIEVVLGAWSTTS